MRLEVLCYRSLPNSTHHVMSVLTFLIQIYKIHPRLLFQLELGHYKVTNRPSPALCAIGILIILGIYTCS